MPKKVPLVSVRVSREGQSISVPPGKAFDFTDDEVADLEKMAKSANTEYLRDPVNEVSSDDAKPAAGRGGKGNKGGSADL